MSHLRFSRMTQWTIKTAVLFVALVATLCAAAPNVTYSASGTFSSPPVSGSDTLKLAGEPFSLSIVANAASVPIQHGPNWGLFSPFKMTGSVHSGLLGPTPVSIASDAASIQLAIGPDYDLFITGFPVKVVGISLTIHATLTLPPGTLVNYLIHPFSSVALTPTNSVVTYSDGTDTTTLTVSTGTVVGSIAPAGAGTEASLIVPASQEAPVCYVMEDSVLIGRRQSV